MPLPGPSLFTSSPEERQRRSRLRSNCHTFLYLHGPEDPAASYKALARYCQQEDCQADHYGAGGSVSVFEERLADLFNKPAAAFMPSGTMAQQIALRIACDRRKGKHIGLHPSSHLAFNEHEAYRELHGLEKLSLGTMDTPYSLADLQSCDPNPQAIVLELPYRWLGGVLPDWIYIQQIAHWCRDNDIHLHLDGARIWEAQSFYNKTLAEISALFDSVYVSFYKTLGAFAGAALLGATSNIKEARIWQRRHGGNLPRIDPLVSHAAMNMDIHLPRVPAYISRMTALAPVLAQIPGVRPYPLPAQTNQIHLHLDAQPKELHRGRDVVAEKYGVWIGNGFFPHPDGGSFMELFAGETLLKHTNQEVITWIQTMVNEAKQ